VPTDQDIRSKTVLDEVFGSDDNTWLSVTSHSGEIASILRGNYFFPRFEIEMENNR